MSNPQPTKNEDDNLGSFYMGRMRPPPEPKRIMPKGLLSIAVFVAFAVILWYAYPQGQEKYTDLDIPVVTADKNAYKFKPDDPGGMEVRHQDSTIFDPLEKKETSAVEKILPQPEEPMNKEEAIADKAPLDSEKAQLNLDTKMEPVAEGTEAVVVKEEPKNEEVKEAVTATPTPKPEPEKTVKKEEPKKVEAAKPVKPVVTAKPAVGFYIQLGSYRDTSGAKTDWGKLRAKHPQLLGGLAMTTKSVDLGKKGVWNRLYAGVLSESRAREICGVLKTQNPGGCIVSKF